MMNLNFYLKFFKQNKILFVVLLFVLGSISTPAQAILNESQQNTQTVKGTITDEAGESIIGASISVVEGTKVLSGTVTDLDGNFEISAPVGAKLRISYLGYLPVELTVISGKTDYSTQLGLDASNLDEVVVIGYGTQKKKLITGANLNVSGENIQKQNTTNVIGALITQAPGLNIVQNNGQPGAGYIINIRGMGTIGNFEPLYVIDGVADGSSGALNRLNPADIESIDVLKDAASAAIYGARAANGVILVTTKSGKKGKPVISYDGFYGFQNLNTNGVRPVSASDYMKYYNLERADNNQPSRDFAAEAPVQYQQVQNGWEGSNWFDAVLNDNAPTTNHSINISGGGDRGTYSLGFSKTYQESTLGNENPGYYDRTTVRINNEYVLFKGNEFDYFKIGEHAYLSNHETRGISQGNQYDNRLRDILTYNPLLPIYDTDGSYYTYDDQVRDKWNLNTTPPANLLQQMDRDNNDNRENASYRLKTNVYAELKPIKQLTFRTVYEFNYNMVSSRTYNDVYFFSPTASRSVDQVVQSLRYDRSWSIDNTIHYYDIFGLHTFDVLLGQSAQEWGFGQELSISKTDTKFPGLFDFAYINNTQSILDEETTALTGKRPAEGSIYSYFGRINYNYNETYLLSAILRRDASSKFAKGHRVGYFPSISGGWVITNEKFMESTNKWMNYLKIRGSWGQLGNDAIDDFAYLATIDLGGWYTFEDWTIQTPGAYPSSSPNPNVTWETSEQLDFGFDARFLRSRLGVTFDWYNKTTKDWLLRDTQLLSAGTNNPRWFNGGKVQNTGVEFSVDWNDRVGDFSYGINVNGAYNKNEVLEIDNEEKMFKGDNNAFVQNMNAIHRCEVGYPMGYFWGLATDGIFQNQKEIDDWIAAGHATKQAKPQPGDVKFLEQKTFNEETGEWEYDGVFNDNDRVMIGQPHPKFRMGLNITLGYKGFDFALSGSGAFGMQIAQNYRRFSDRPEENFTNNYINKLWTGEGSTNSFPRLTYGKHENLTDFSDIFLQNADYFKFRTITLGYDFKQGFKNIPFFSQLRAYVQLQNFFTLTGYDGMDPEVSYNLGKNWGGGVDIGTFPDSRSVIIGVNIKF